MRKEVIETIHSYIEEMTTVKKEPKESKNAFLSIETVQCHLKNGKTISRDQLKKNGKAGSAVVILPITKQNTTVITIQPRVFTEKTVGIALPAGYKEANETYEEAALRELVEENFRNFFRRNIIQYKSYLQIHEIRVGFVGGIAGSFVDILSKVAREEGYEMGEVISSPIDGLISYHGA